MPRQKSVGGAWKRISALSALLCLLAVPGGSPQAQEVYRFGVVPQFEALRLAEIWQPVLDELSARTGYRFEMTGSARIPEFETSFLAGEFDFAYMNPYHCLLAMESQGYVPLVKDGSRLLFGVLVARKDGPVRSVQDLEGQEVSFPAPNALGASLLVRADLAREYGIEIRPVYVHTHTSSYLNAALGATAAAGGVMSTFNRQSPEIRDSLEVIYETTRVAPHPVMAHPRVPEDVCRAVREAFLDMAATDEGAALLKKIPIGRAVPAEPEDYAPLAELGLAAFYEE